MGGTKHCGRRSPWDQSKEAAREASTTGERWDQAREDLLAMESAASGSLTSRGGGPSTKTLPVGHTQAARDSSTTQDQTLQLHVGHEAACD